MSRRTWSDREPARSTPARLRRSERLVAERID
jgi:hypothetical protein